MSLPQDLANNLGVFPGVELRIRSVQIVGIGAALSVKKFLSYSFKTSILVPADQFTFTFAAPDDPRSFRSYFQEGDIAELYCNNKILATGIIDEITVRVDDQGGEQVTVSGRDFMGQLQDQDSVNLDSSMLYGNIYTPTQLFQYLLKNTRIQNFRLQNFPKNAQPLFSTLAGETKLSSLIRYMEPMNVVAWMDPDGTIVMGKPNMGADPGSRLLFMNKANRQSNCLDMQVTYAAATIPNAVIPVWTEQSEIQNRISPEQVLLNAAVGPSRLRSVGHFLPKAIVVSSPAGGRAQDLTKATQFQVTPGGSNFLQAYAKREVARQNTRERIVKATMAGHLDQSGNPFRTDTTWNVLFDRGDISGDKMYLYEAQFTLDPRDGQKTSIALCNVNTIVADIPTGS